MNDEQARSGVDASRKETSGSDAPAALRPETDPIRLGDLLTYRISILAKLLDRRTAAMLGREFGLKVAEWRVLAQLSVAPTRTVRWLATEMRVDRAEVSRAAATLIARGLVRRMADPSDARSALFCATDDGRALYGRIMPRRVEQHAALVRSLGGEAGHDDLRRALDALIASLSAE